jgi:pSer/pThr/pTyr-binding forkhead associated (FHA) protein
MLGQLEVIAGPDAGRQFPLVEGQVLQIGRGPSTQTRLTDPFVSRLHCQVSAENGVILLTDLGGAGGTRVNGKKIEKPQLLMPGDVVAIGDTRLRLHMETVHDQGTIVRPREPVPSFCPLPEDISQLVGQSLEKYRIERLIAKGRCGWVFYAQDTPTRKT